MAFETALPAPRPEWWAELIYPGSVGVGLAMPTSTLGSSDYLTKPAFKAGATSLIAGTTGGGGVTKGYSNRLGRIHARALSTGANWLEAYYFPWWTFRGDNVADLAPGYQEDDVNRVAWLRIGNTQSAVDATWGEGTGFFFVPYVGVALTADSALPGGPTFPGGVGLCGDGAGGWQYRSWDAAGAPIATVAVPPAVIGTLTQERLFDFIFRCSTTSSLGWLTVRVNGQDIVTEQPYDGVSLIAPNALSNQAFTQSLCIGSRNPGTGTVLYWWMHARFGRFLPDGTEVQ